MADKRKDRQKEIEELSLEELKKKIKKDAGRYGAVFLYPAVGDEPNLKTSSGYGGYLFQIQ